MKKRLMVLLVLFWGLLGSGIYARCRPMMHASPAHAMLVDPNDPNDPNAPLLPPPDMGE